MLAEGGISSPLRALHLQAPIHLAQAAQQCVGVAIGVKGEVTDTGHDAANHNQQYRKSDLRGGCSKICDPIPSAFCTEHTSICGAGSLPRSMLHLAPPP